jgi:hemolysin activation/secretion protein
VVVRKDSLKIYFISLFNRYFVFLIGFFLSSFSYSQDGPAFPLGESERQLIREQERSDARQKEQKKNVDVRLEGSSPTLKNNVIPDDETPCFPIDEVVLVGEKSESFQWLLKTISSTDNVITHPLATTYTQSSKKNADILGRCLGVTGIGVIISQLQNRLIDKGYVTSRILAGSQDLTTGILELTLVLGEINDIRFSDENFYGNTLPMSIGDILNLRDIEQALESIKRLPSVDADINILPAEGENKKPGDSDLLIDWNQSSPVRIVANVDNFGSESTGIYQGGLSLAYDNLFGLHEIMTLSFNHDVGGAEPLKGGTESYSFSYTVPYKNWDVAVNFSKNTFFQTVQGPFEKFQFSGESHNASLAFTRLVHRDSVRKINLTLGGWFRSSKNFTNDSENPNQRRRTSGYEMSVDYREFIRSSILNASVTYRRGTGAFDALDAPEALFNEGVSHPSIMKTNVQFSTPFSIGSQRFTYSSEWRRQLNRDRLITQDRFSIGGHFTVRGFDGESTLLAERGWLIRNDFALALGQSNHQLYLGIDYGEVGGFLSEFLIGDYLSGAVIGVKGGIKSISYDAFFGQPIHQPDGFITDNFIAQFSLHWVY